MITYSKLPISGAELVERAAEFFEIGQPDPFMTMAPRVLIRAAIHVDCTARIQTVNRADNPRGLPEGGPASTIGISYVLTHCARLFCTVGPMPFAINEGGRARQGLFRCGLLGPNLEIQIWRDLITLED